MHDPDELLSARETARILNTSGQTVYRLINSGKLPAVKVSPRLLRIRRADLEAYIADRQGASE